MHIEIVPNRGSKPCILLRESYRLGGKVRKRTLANLSKLPPAAIDGLRILLRGGSTMVGDLACRASRWRKAAPTAMWPRCWRPCASWDSRAIFDPAGARRERDLVVAMIVARILEPASKLRYRPAAWARRLR